MTSIRSFMPILNTARNGAESDWSGIASLFGKKLFAAILTDLGFIFFSGFSSTLVRAMNNFIAIKKWLKVFVAYWTVLKVYWLSFAFLGYTSTFITTIFGIITAMKYGIKFHATNYTVYISLGVFLAFFVVRNVFGGGENLKIFNSVIRLITVKMMNMFIGLKASANMLRHYVSMFKNLMIFIGHGMAMRINPYITSVVDSSTASPVMMLRTKLSKILSFSRINHRYTYSFEGRYNIA